MYIGYAHTYIGIYIYAYICTSYIQKTAEGCRGSFCTRYWREFWHMCCSVCQRVAVCCSVLQWVAVCCSVLRCVEVQLLYSLLARSLGICVTVCCGVLWCVAVCCSVLECVALCCSVLQCVAECCSVLQSSF